MMHEKRGLAAVRGLLVPVAAAAVLLCFLTALSNLEQGRDDEGKRPVRHAVVLPVVKAAAASRQSQHRHTGAAIYLKLHLAVQHTAPLFVIGTLHHNQSSTPFLS